MAESADILTGDHQQVILPDLNAGCSMADMADLDAGRGGVGGAGRRHRHRPGSCPITYMNSSAALKAFVGRARRRGVHLDQRPGRARVGASGPAEGAPAAARCCSSPTSTSAATPASPWATPHDDMRVWNPRLELGGLTEADVKEATFLLWKGHCSVHQRFRPEHVAAFRAEHPDGIVVAHPECALRRVRAGRPGRLHRLHHPGGRGRAGGVDHRRRHRDPPGPPARRRDPGQDRSCRSTR